ncbi:hypothetical protein [Spongiivirga sp. MCCC 1A20706]|uniref:hypothetical protein n=1 Tax=Spongiivirga sp. MCCC 1A20706 TaxID=3160963 RepID=UPI0039775ECF
MKSHVIYQDANTLLHFPYSYEDINFDIFKMLDSISPTWHEIRIKDLESNEYKKDWGLQIKANSYRNFQGVLDDETNNITVSRFNAELEWDILKGGFFANRTKATTALLEKQLLNDALERENKIIWRRQFRLHYNYAINQELLNHYTSKSKFLEKYFDILNELYSQKMIKREEVIKISNELYNSREQSKQIQFYQDHVADSIPALFLNEKLPLIKIDLNKDDIFKSPKNEDKKIWKQHIIKLKNRAFRDIKFSIYANYNWTETITRQFSSPLIGARFSAPIRFNNRKKIIQTKIQQATAQEDDRLVGKQNQLVTYLNAHQEKINDLYTLHKKWLIIQQRKTITQIIKEELNTYNCGLLLLQYTKEQYDIIENVLQLKKQLYTIVSHIIELSPESNIHQFISSVAFNTGISLDPVVITKSSFSQRLQLQFLKAKNIQRIQMTFQDGAFENLLKKEGIQVSFEQPTPNAVFLKDLISNELELISKK